jgi:hypothetical protein
MLEFYDRKQTREQNNYFTIYKFILYLHRMNLNLINKLPQQHRPKIDERESIGYF